MSGFKTTIHPNSLSPSLPLYPSFCRFWFRGPETRKGSHTKTHQLSPAPASSASTTPFHAIAFSCLILLHSCLPCLLICIRGSRLRFTITGNVKSSPISAAPY